MATGTTDRDAFVVIGKARVKGRENVSAGVQRFLGVPYAEPPTGARRFARPKPLEGRNSPYNHEETLDCTQFKSVCPQPIYSVDGKPLSRPPNVTFSEDCLYLNIWVPSPAEPTSSPPASGWPVLVWIHGGWYQIGNPLQGPDNDPTQLIAKTSAGLQAIVVAIGYRLNCFGFLASADTQGNYGLWDQRLALEWIHHHIASFGGDAKNVTLAGLSAGANGVHHQMHYEFFQSTKRDGMFHRAIMYSNAISSQPKPAAAAQASFDELCAACDISADLSPAEKLDALRQVKDVELAGKISSLTHHTFRCVTDGDFVSEDLMQHAQDGSFAAEFKKRGFRLIIGEVENEETVYAAVNSPDTRAAFLPQLQNYYATHTAERLFRKYPFPASSDESSPGAWHAHFGKIVAAAQVRAPIRRLCDQLQGNQVFRYRISKRLSALTRLGVAESFGVGHGMDQMIWWYQTAMGYTPEERAAVDAWLQPLVSFVHGDASVNWGTADIHQVRRLMQDGAIASVTDGEWDEFGRFAEILMPVSESA